MKDVMPKQPWIVLGVSVLVVGLNSCALGPKIILGENANESAAVHTATPLWQGADAQAQSFRINVDEQGRALRGYDPVAYFTDGEAILGQEAHRFSWNGTEWFFATAENRDRFTQNPTHYAPSNGGYCTFGVVLRKKLDGNPEVWSIFNGDLYVFLNEEVREKFLQDKTGNLARVTENWPQIQDKSPEELE